MAPVDSLGQGMRAGSWLLGREGPRAALLEDSKAAVLGSGKVRRQLSQATCGSRGCYQENWGSLLGILTLKWTQNEAWGQCN